MLQEKALFSILLFYFILFFKRNYIPLAPASWKHATCITGFVYFQKTHIMLSLTHSSRSHICRLPITSDKKVLLCGQQSAMLFIILPDWKILHLLTFFPNSYALITMLVLGICGSLRKIQILFFSTKQIRNVY